MNDRIIDGFVDLGLTPYEARTYVSLVQREPGTAEEVAVAAEVPKGRIYDVLNSLSERSLVRTDDGRPKIYSATGSVRAVDHLLETRLYELDEQRADYTQLADTLKDLLSSLETNRSDAGFSTSAFHDDDAHDLLLDRFEAAEESIQIMIGETPARAEADDEGMDLLRQRLTEGIEVQLLATTPIEWSEESNERPEIRIADSDVIPDHRFVVIDGTEACIEVVRPTTPDQLLAVINFRNNQPAWDLAETFESLWQAASPSTTHEI
ncbi:TrmB family transcriptional regulator [Halalkalicoccus salilacus]|uniref:TrmB family transcriptional regulator n=1 Tax=Halalkalicoccus salilacus TaxID=3117459 RepID=UPI00300E8BC8